MGRAPDRLTPDEARGMIRRMVNGRSKATRTRAWLAVMSVVALVGAACSPPPDIRGLQNLSRGYEEELLRWTSSSRVYHGLDRVMFVHATYLSPKFRQAFGVQYLAVFGIDPGKVDSDLERLATSEGRGLEFFVFMDTSDYSWNNLDERGSVWRMALWGGADQLGTPPASIHRFKGRGPNLQAFFPYLNGYGRSYLVTFPLQQANGNPILSESGGSLVIRLSSAFGVAELSWRVGT
ncbi:MAG: hypothetical protein GYA21_07485 [Myxococcales bacterium]|nr:hypothetical protein [Myxococcales bacterium]